jgi:hypothetical protein
MVEPRQYVAGERSRRVGVGMTTSNRMATNPENAPSVDEPPVVAEPLLLVGPERPMYAIQPEILKLCIR